MDDGDGEDKVAGHERVGRGVIIDAHGLAALLGLVGEAEFVETVGGVGGDGKRGLEEAGGVVETSGIGLHVAIGDHFPAPDRVDFAKECGVGGNDVFVGRGFEDVFDLHSNFLFVGKAGGIRHHDGEVVGGLGFVVGGTEEEEVVALDTEMAVVGMGCRIGEFEDVALVVVGVLGGEGSGGGPGRLVFGDGARGKG